MKFYLIENGQRVQLTESDTEYHFYGNPKTGLYYFDGTKLRQITPGVAKKLADKKSESEDPMSDAEKAARKAKLKKIKSELSGSDLFNELETEKTFYGQDEGDKLKDTGHAVPKSKREMIEASIYDFVADQVGVDLDWGYGKDSPMSLNPDILKKVRRHKHTETKPEINLYFDRSGSWSGSYFDNFAADIMSVLYDFEQAELIDVNVYYFAVHVWADENKALSEINNSGEPIIQHMIETQPTNVVIMTDNHLSEPDDYDWDTANCTGHKVSYMESKYVAPGAVWAIFVGGIPRTLIRGYGEGEEWHLYGDELTKVFTFKRGET